MESNNEIERESGIPYRFICPITATLMIFPMTGPDLKSYEKKAIEIWLRMHSTSPITRQTMRLNELQENLTLKEEIEKWISEDSLRKDLAESIKNQFYDTPNQMDVYSEMSNGVETIEELRGRLRKRPVNAIGSLVFGIVKLLCMNKRVQFVSFDSGLRITPYHPVRLSLNKHDVSFGFIHPIDFKQLDEYECDAVYSFVLKNDHIMIINDIEVICLGHNFDDRVENSLNASTSKKTILYHPFFGTEKIISDLEKYASWTATRIVTITPDHLVKDTRKNLIIGLNNTP
jgi:hypothetical protein